MSVPDSISREDGRGANLLSRSETTSGCRRGIGNKNALPIFFAIVRDIRADSSRKPRDFESNQMAAVRGCGMPCFGGHLHGARRQAESPGYGAAV